MTESTQSPSIEQATLEELTAAIAELEDYKERLVSETLAAAQKAKVKKAQAHTNLEPAIAKIDSMLAELHQRKAALASEN